jgi:two-component system response regulator RegA
MSQPNNDTPTLLLVDDDATFRSVLSRALEKRGFTVTTADSVEAAIPLALANPPEFAIIDLKMHGASGLMLVQKLHELDAATRIVMLTGYANIATAVEAIKLGATQYLSKPANADEIMAAFGHSACADVAVETHPTSVDKLEWEHINRVLHEQKGNISNTARVLNMHRRTLQRKLAKRPA